MKNDGKINFFGLSDMGRQRTNNEDAFVAEALDENTVLAVAIDGVGGYEGGEVAAAIAQKEIPEYLKKRILDEIPDVKVNSPDDACPLILNMSFVGCRAEVILHSLEQDEIYVSTGSACSSKDKGSHVLSAMGLRPEEIEGAVRFSFSSENTKEQMDIVAEKLKVYVESQRKLRSSFRRR